MMIESEAGEEDDEVHLGPRAEGCMGGGEVEEAQRAIQTTPTGTAIFAAGVVIGTVGHDALRETGTTTAVGGEGGEWESVLRRARSPILWSDSLRERSTPGRKPYFGKG